MHISEVVLRRLIREVLEEYKPTKEEIIVRTVDDYFSGSNRKELAVRQDTRDKYERAADFLDRIRGPELIDEVKALRKIVNVVSTKNLDLTDEQL